MFEFSVSICIPPKLLASSFLPWELAPLKLRAESTRMAREVGMESLCPRNNELSGVTDLNRIGWNFSTKLTCVQH